MAANTRLATAAQILCVLAYRGNATTSEDIAQSLQTNPVVVRRSLKDLEAAGLVSLRPGRDGGVQLDVTPDRITLGQVLRAVEEDRALFALRGDGNARCPVNRGMERLLAPAFGRAAEAASASLDATTIADLVADL